MIHVLIVLSAWSGAGAATYYVDQAGAGGGGTGWATAFTNLQQALAIVVSNDQIWVAQGTYYPTNGTDRNATFKLQRGVTLYGGFTNGMTDPALRNWTNYPTRLSGNIGDLATNTDNCYHVLLGTNNAAMDGFFIQDGTADASYGGALYNTQSPAPRIFNCTFVSNISSTGSGAIYDTGHSLWLENCILYNNGCTNLTTSGLGGAMGISATNVWINGCTFSNNYCRANSSSGGAIYFYAAASNNTITNTVFFNNRFTNNTVSTGGGAIYNANPGLIVNRCQFIGNFAQYGGAIDGALAALLNTKFFGNSALISNGDGAGGLVSGSPGVLLISNCVFAANTATRWGGGIRVAGPAYIVDCIFTRNTGSLGGALYNTASNLLVERCLFIGNGQGVGVGGAVGHYLTGPGPLFKNCLFAGNIAWTYGGAIMNANATSAYENCTFTANRANVYDGGCINNGSAYSYGSASLVNCILWTNQAAAGRVHEIYTIAGSTSTIAYCDVSSTNSSVVTNVVDGGGLIFTDALFAAPVTGGVWSANPVYDGYAGQTLLTDGAAHWVNNELTGRCLRPNSSNVYQLALIAANTLTNIWVWGDATTLTTNAYPYSLHDFHLQKGSPCINAGTNTGALAGSTDLDRLSRVDRFYGRVDMGAYEFLSQGALFNFH